jgi:hypothetical protein
MVGFVNLLIQVAKLVYFWKLPYLCEIIVIEKPATTNHAGIHHPLSFKKFLSAHPK